MVNGMGGVVRRIVGLLGVSALALACAGQGAEKPPTVASKAANGSGKALPETPLTKVAAPADLVFVGRVKNPGKALDLLSSWVSLPLDWRALLAQEAKGFKVVDLSGSVDVAVALAPESTGDVPVVAAFSFPVTSVDAAAESLRKAGYSVVRAGAHAYRVGEEEPCVIVRSLGTSAARVVCSPDQEGLDALGPYMSRGMPTEEFGDADVVAEVRLEPVRKQYGRQAPAIKLGVPFVLQEVSIGDARFDAAVAEIVRALADEAVAWTEDLSLLRWDLWLREKEQRLDTRVAVKFSGQASWVAQTIAAAPARQAVAPSLFWKLPVDADAGSYSVAAEPGRADGIVRVSAELAEAALVHIGVGAPRAAAFGKAIRGIASVTGPSALASVPVTVAKDAPVAETTAEMLRRTLGIYLVGFEGDNGALKTLFDESLKVYQDGAIRKYAKTHEVDAASLPTVARRNVPASRKLPAGSIEYTLTVPEKFASKVAEDVMNESTLKHEKLEGTLVLMPKDGATWAAFSVDREELYARLSAVNSGAGQSLTQREGLDTLKSVPALGGGFESLSSYLSRYGSLLEQVAKEGDAGFDASAFRKLEAESLPHQGKTPMVSQLRASTDGPMIAYDLTVSKATFEDVAMLTAVIMAAMQ